MSLDTLVEEALSAFRKDHSYAVAMTKQANAIQLQRDVGACRRELRAAEAAAQEACRRHPMYFICEVSGPCGTGRCLFAPAELRELDVPHSEGTSERPTLSAYGDTYGVESAVRPLYELRYG